MKKIILLLFLCLIPFSAQANNELELELLNECNLQYGGDKCVSELRITNNTNTDLDGTGIFTGWHNSSPLLQTPVGIDTLFGLSNEQNGWQAGSIIFSDFTISQGETLTNLKIITNPALTPGPYTFSFCLVGMTEDESYTSPVIRGGGGVVWPLPEKHPTKEELLERIKLIQMQIIIVLYKLIIQAMQQLLLLR